MRVIHLLRSISHTTSTEQAAIAYVHAGFRPTPLSGLARGSTPTAPICLCGRHPECDPRIVDGVLKSSAGKHPRCPAWQKQHLTDDEIKHIWRATDGVGLIMGPCTRGDLIAIDIDGAIGYENLKIKQAEYGKLPLTLTARSGSGGLHLVFRIVLPDGSRSEIRNDNTSKCAVGIDVRAHGGGQIAVSPTRHYSGNIYRWTRPIEPAILPLAWYDLLRRK